MNLKKIDCEIRKKYKESGAMSITYIMRKYKMSSDAAATTMDILSKSTCRGIYNNNN